LSKPSAIVFDFGGVLLDWDPRYLYQQLFAGDVSAMESFLAETDFYGWNNLQDAGRSFSSGVAEACERFPQYCELIRAYDTRWEESIAGPIHGTIELLRGLKGQGYRLYGLSNWSAEKFYLVRHRFDFMDWFEDIIVSGEVKLIKPDPKIFHLLLTRLGLPAEAVLLVDDSLKNIEAARQLGFHTVHFTSPCQLSNALKAKGILEDARSDSADQGPE
jgi:2-haloacid dehalogenase